MLVPSNKYAWHSPTKHDTPAAHPIPCRYLEGKAQLLYPEPRDVFPCELIHSEACVAPWDKHESEAED